MSSRESVRFAVGHPDGMSSNSWKVWATRNGDVYIACRDSFREAKVSLHVSGRWRMGFTSEAVNKNQIPLRCDENRAWEVWDRPYEFSAGAVIAFRLLFPTSELFVSPDQRHGAKWKEVVFIEAAPPGKVTVLSLFMTTSEVILRHESEPSFCLANLDAGKNLRAQIVAHGDPEGELPRLIKESVEISKHEAQLSGIEIPKNSVGYFFGQQKDGGRFIFGARLR